MKNTKKLQLMNGNVKSIENSFNSRLHNTIKRFYVHYTYKRDTLTLKNIWVE